MKKWKVACALPLAAMVMALDAPPPQPTDATLHLTLENLRSGKGHVRICLWSDGSGFPDCKKNDGVRRVHVPVHGNAVTVDIAGLAPGHYGVSVIHDENDNRKLDKSFIGLPTEGVGFSNNASAPFGPPKFDRVAFEVKGASDQKIRMRYYL